MVRSVRGRGVWMEETGQRLDQLTFTTVSLALHTGRYVILNVVQILIQD